MTLYRELKPYVGQFVSLYRFCDASGDGIKFVGMLKKVTKHTVTFDFYDTEEKTYTGTTIIRLSKIDYFDTVWDDLIELRAHKKTEAMIGGKYGA
jgi:hypothetical protein